MSIENPAEHDPVKIKDALIQKIIERTVPDREDMMSHSDEWRALNLGKFNLLFDKKVAEDQSFLAKCELNLDDVAKQFEIMLIGNPNVPVSMNKDIQKAA